jgi:hypothetical protein
MRSLGISTAHYSAVTRRFLQAFVLTLGLIPLQCATLERLSLDDMIVKSTAIVRGKVTATYAAPSGPIVYTHYTLQVSERFKGPSQGPVDVAVPGGTLNGVRYMVEGAPEFHVGEEYVFFLYTGKSGLAQVIGMTQGFFSLAQDGVDPTGTRRYSRELMLDPHTGQPTKDETLVMRVSELRARVAATLAAGKGAAK